MSQVTKKLAAMRIDELRTLARDVGLLNYSRLKKAELAHELENGHREAVLKKLEPAWWEKRTTHV